MMVCLVLKVVVGSVHKGLHKVDFQSALWFSSKSVPQPRG